MITWADFEKVEMRIGTILSAKDFPSARNPSYILHIDFGEYGIKKSSAQITTAYSKADLLGRQVVGVINFPPKQIADLMSECLILGVVGNDQGVILLSTERQVENGLRIA